MRNKFYMNEFQYHDGECYVTFNIVDLILLLEYSIFLAHIIE